MGTWKGLRALSILDFGFSILDFGFSIAVPGTSNKRSATRKTFKK
jgi:hypothetical protein